MAKETLPKNMTVETETVSSVPQVALATASAQGGASVRSKKSTDTIKAPKKEKRKPTKRSGAGSTSNRMYHLYAWPTSLSFNLNTYP
jgi:hypothetical protein